MICSYTKCLEINKNTQPTCAIFSCKLQGTPSTNNIRKRNHATVNTVKIIVRYDKSAEKINYWKTTKDWCINRCCKYVSERKILRLQGQHDDFDITMLIDVQPTCAVKELMISLAALDFSASSTAITLASLSCFLVFSSSASRSLLSPVSFAT